jgi:acyl-coenzyme A synthetase/AMP-(fatty) acid ligase
MDADEQILAIPRLAKKNEITALPVVPTLLAALFRARLLKPEYFPNLRYISSTGEKLDTSLISSSYEAMPKVEIIPMYGLTECKRVSIMPPNRRDKILAGSCGLPLDGVEVRLADKIDGEG